MADGPVVQLRIRVIDERVLREQFEDWKLQDDESDDTDEVILERLKGATLEEIVAYVVDTEVNNAGPTYPEDCAGWRGLGLERIKEK